MLGTGSYELVIYRYQSLESDTLSATGWQQHAGKMASNSDSVGAMQQAQELDTTRTPTAATATPIPTHLTSSSTSNELDQQVPMQVKAAEATITAQHSTVQAGNSWRTNAATNSGVLKAAAPDGGTHGGTHVHTHTVPDSMSITPQPQAQAHTTTGSQGNAFETGSFKRRGTLHGPGALLMYATDTLQDFGGALHCLGAHESCACHAAPYRRMHPRMVLVQPHVLLLDRDHACACFGVQACE